MWKVRKDGRRGERKGEWVSQLSSVVLKRLRNQLKKNNVKGLMLIVYMYVFVDGGEPESRQSCGV